MRVGRTVQPLSYELRLPDAVQAAALRLLDASREIINATVVALWERLDDVRLTGDQVCLQTGHSDDRPERAPWRSAMAL